LPSGENLEGIGGGGLRGDEDGREQRWEEGL
jgi:hypothetical protein